MGGHGSGREEYATTATVDECLTIEMSFLREQEFLDAGKSGTLRWSRDGRPVASLRWTVDDVEADSESEDEPKHERALALSYTAPDGEYTYAVPIETTPCNFGGERPWFRCPGPAGEACDERVGKLHRPPNGGRYLCRQCHDLAYESSRASGNPKRTARLRYERAHRKLRPDADAHGPALGRIVTKPKEMHRETFREIHAELAEAHNDWMRALMHGNARMHGHYERVYDQLGNDGDVERNKASRKEIEDSIESGQLWLCPADTEKIEALRPGSVR